MNTNLLELLILCGIILFSIWIYKIVFINNEEGFQQNERFLLKTGNDCYDDFYTEIYDSLWKPYNRVKYETTLILDTLQPDIEFSNMLDVGSGTGSFLNELKIKGYNVSGVDISKSMSEKAIENYSLKNKYDYVVGDILDPMMYERSIFTHIFCIDFTLYEFECKKTFFKNCYYWLQNNGYLIIHLADMNNFNPIIPAAKPFTLESIKQFGTKRITTTEIDFPEFIYESDYISKGIDKIIHKESFTDKKTQNIRQNERTLFFETNEDIIKLAADNGFIAKGYLSLIDGPSRDSFQQIVIFERTT
jgi:SAM-dependent methyltransferase